MLCRKWQDHRLSIWNQVWRLWQSWWTWGANIQTFKTELSSSPVPVSEHCCCPNLQHVNSSGRLQAYHSPLGTQSAPNQHTSGFLSAAAQRAQHMFPLPPAGRTSHSHLVDRYQRIVEGISEAKPRRLQRIKDHSHRGPARHGAPPPFRFHDAHSTEEKETECLRNQGSGDQKGG